MRYLVECLGYSAFRLEFYIAIDIILICLTGDCSITNLKLRDPIKVMRLTPQLAFLLIIGLLLCSIKLEHPKCN